MKDDLTMEQALAEAQRIDPTITRVRRVSDCPSTVLGDLFVAFSELQPTPKIIHADGSWENLFNAIIFGIGDVTK